MEEVFRYFGISVFQCFSKRRAKAPSQVTALSLLPTYRNTERRSRNRISESPIHRVAATETPSNTLRIAFVWDPFIPLVFIHGVDEPFFG